MSTKILRNEKQLLEIRDKKSLVLISGSFDILHVGHLELFENAKNKVPEGKILVILLSDQNIRSRKLDNRPINNENDRAKLLAGLECVDYIYIWSKPWQDLRLLIPVLKPGYIALNQNDAGYNNKKEIVERNGGKVLTFKKRAGISTTTILKKINSL